MGGWDRGGLEEEKVKLKLQLRADRVPYLTPWRGDNIRYRAVDRRWSEGLSPGSRVRDGSNDVYIQQ